LTKGIKTIEGCVIINRITVGTVPVSVSVEVFHCSLHSNIS
jgi:hypothetical protein